MKSWNFERTHQKIEMRRLKRFHIWEQKQKQNCRDRSIPTKQAWSNKKKTIKWCPYKCKKQGKPKIILSINTLKYVVLYSTSSRQDDNLRKKNMSKKLKTLLWGKNNKKKKGRWEGGIYIKGTNLRGSRKIWKHGEQEKEHGQGSSKNLTKHLIT